MAQIVEMRRAGMSDGKETMSALHLTSRSRVKPVGSGSRIMFEEILVTFKFGRTVFLGAAMMSQPILLNICVRS